MKEYKNRKQLQSASDEEILNFFANTIFSGVFKKEVRSKKNPLAYKGHIANIKLKGINTDFCPNFLNVPKKAKVINEGLCFFRCKINLAALYEADPRWIVTLDVDSLEYASQIENMGKNLEIEKRHSERELFDLWGLDNCQFIGCYKYDKESSSYIIEDLRKPNFDHIPYYPTDKDKKPIKIVLPKELGGIELNSYYLFEWKLSHINKENPFEICLDFTKQPQRIQPEWFIETLFNDRVNDKSKNFGSAANFLDTLSKQLSAKESTFVYELLQNASDYPLEGEGVDVEFHITDNYLLFLHSGDYFNIRNISGICGINEKEKVANKKTIGYKGIGFKTVFLNNHYVYLRSGSYSFRFDEGETPEKKVGGKIKRLGAPFQILPIWTEPSDVEKEVKDVFDHSNNKFRVKIALRPDDKALLHYGRNSYENLFSQIFSDSNIILFTPNIDSVKVYIDGTIVRNCKRDNAKWIVNDFEQVIDIDLQNLINKTIDKGKSRIPEKYKDFDVAKVSFACNRSGSYIKPVDNSILYCYLPTTTSWGFPFLMNTDMIPKGDRNNIETEVLLIDDETNFNKELTKIAGTQFFNWLVDLIDSNNFDKGSVFSLVPNFEKCIAEHNEYEEYIESFQDCFEATLYKKNLIPVASGLANISNVVYDTTGLSSSGIMSDEEFLTFLDLKEENLPAPEVRNSDALNIFLNRYVDDPLKISKINLLEMTSNMAFQKWLKVQENNNKFLNFLLEKEWLQDFLEKEIFIEGKSGSLYKASDLYYDVDEELKDLSAFSKYICFLSLKTREYFKDNEKWLDIIEDEFDEFDGDCFIKDTLLCAENINETKISLGDWDTSYHFFLYIAKNNIVPSQLKDLPFFNDENEPRLIDDFNDKFVFISSSKGREVCNSHWLSPLVFEFISSKYDEVILKYLMKYAGVVNYADEYVIKNIILSPNYIDEIDDAQQDDLTYSLAFVNFCFEHEEYFEKGSLKDYALHAFNCARENCWVFSENDLFFPSSCFSFYAQKEWLQDDWMFCLDESYWINIHDKERLKKFISKTFCISDLDEKNFYKKIVKKNLSGIIENTSGGNDSEGRKNLDFVSYLDENYKLIFEEEKDKDKFSSFVLLGKGEDSIYDISHDEKYIYAYDEELEEILNSDWFPADKVCMCTDQYDSSKAILVIRAKKYIFSEFFCDVISEELNEINKTINSKEASIAFHNFVLGHLKTLTDVQKATMKGAKIYLLENGNASNSSTGHKILSRNARELAEMKLVKFSELDIIDPEYNIASNEEYWKTHLGNEPFTANDFLKWVKENSDLFYKTLENVENNINFWRWLKASKVSVASLEALPNLPILLNSEKFENSSQTIYFSDKYIEEGGIEKIVKSYNKNASFISGAYIRDNEDISSWKDFWVKLNVRFEMVDILIDTIDNRLNEMEDENLPSIIANYRTELEKYYGDNFIASLADLKVKAYDDLFYNLSDVIYVDCEKEEPFVFISLPNEVKFTSSNERRLIKEILDYKGCKTVERLAQWRSEKIALYLEIQNNSESDDLIRSLHYEFIDELANLYENPESFTPDQISQIKKIHLFNAEGLLCPGDTLTLGSIFKPTCDFERFNIEYSYLSESYKSNCKNDVSKIMKGLFKVHHYFKTKKDIQNLKDREFAIYFWSEYLTQPYFDINGVVKLIEENKFDNVSCIPTLNCMKKPSEVYSWNISKYVKNHVLGWEDKLPLEDLPDIEFDPNDKQKTIFGILLNKPTNLNLSFKDAINALTSIRSQEGRIKILNWMIESYDSKFENDINEYRTKEEAQWRNVKNREVHVSNLYALAYGDKMLDQYFGNLPCIINKDYLPGNADQFKRVCDILKISVIKQSDLIITPTGKKNHNDIYKTRLKISVLVLAAYDDIKNWSEKFKGYCDLINSMNLWCCNEISVSYNQDENVCQNMKKFYHEKGSNDFYFVNSLDDKRVFQSFVDNFIEYIGLRADGDLIETVMDSQDNALDKAIENNELMLDDQFKNALGTLVPELINSLEGYDVVDEEEVSESNRITISSTQEIDKRHQEIQNDYTSQSYDKENDLDKAYFKTLSDKKEESKEIEKTSTEVGEYGVEETTESSESNLENNVEYINKVVSTKSNNEVEKLGKENKISSTTNERETDSENQIERGTSRQNNVLIDENRGNNKFEDYEEHNQSSQSTDPEKENNFEDQTYVDELEEIENSDSFISKEEIIDFDENELQGLKENIDGVKKEDFVKLTVYKYLDNGKEQQLVSEHYRSGTYVSGHYRNGYWVNGYYRGGSYVSSHTRSNNASHGFGNINFKPYVYRNNTERSSSSPHVSNDSIISGSNVFEREKSISADNKKSPHAYNANDLNNNQEHKTNSKPRDVIKGKDDHVNDFNKYHQSSSPKDFDKLRSHGNPRTLETLEPTQIEISEINNILGSNLTPEEIVDQNYLSRLRLYNSLKQENLSPKESKSDFVRNITNKKKNKERSGKYIHACSAYGGVMYISPSIWNMLSEGKCMICVYYGAKANEFMYIKSKEDLLKWIGEDDIIIKLTGEEKVNVVNTLYSGLLNGVKGTAYTLIRLANHTNIDSLFANYSSRMEESDDENDYIDIDLY